MRPINHRERMKREHRRKTRKALNRAVEMYNIPMAELITSRTRAVTEPRFLACLASKAAGASYPQIAHVLHRDHSTIVTACQQALKYVNESPGLRCIFEELYDAAASGTEYDVTRKGNTKDDNDFDPQTADPYEIPLSRIRPRSTHTATGARAG